jgi:hypothetical protein
MLVFTLPTLADELATRRHSRKQEPLSRHQYRFGEWTAGFSIQGNGNSLKGKGLKSVVAESKLQEVRTSHSRSG